MELKYGPWGRVMVGVRRTDTVMGKFFDNMTEFLIRGGIRHGDGYSPCGDRLAHHAANEIAYRLLKNPNMDAAWYVDSDCEFDLNTLERMRTLAEGQQFDIFGAFCTGRRWPIASVWMKRDKETGKYTNQKVTDMRTEAVDGLGLHCVLIRRRVFEKLAEPWFWYPKEMIQGTEDIPFCESALAAGFKIGITSKIRVRHWGMYPWGWDEYQATLAVEGTKQEKIPEKWTFSD